MFIPTERQIEYAAFILRELQKTRQATKKWFELSDRERNRWTEKARQIISAASSSIIHFEEISSPEERHAHWIATSKIFFGDWNSVEEK